MDCTSIPLRLQESMRRIGVPERGQQTWLMRQLHNHGHSITQAGVNHWFKSGKQPSLEHLVCMSRMFGVSLDWLVTGQTDSHVVELRRDIDTLTRAVTELLDRRAA